MILSVSRRTDIPAFYSEWFLNRIKDGYVLVRNPLNVHQITKIPLSPKVIDCIVFWTKNPERMIDKLSALRGYNYYFQFTLNPYGGKFEQNLQDKSHLVECFIKLSNLISKERVIWRYDPIFMNKDIDLEYHRTNFEMLVSRLKGYTKRCVISFIDTYAKIQKRLESQGIRPLMPHEMHSIGKMFVHIAGKNNIEIVSCAEGIDLADIGIQHGKCIDDKLISEIIGMEIDAEKDGTQRKECGCVASIDIGAYNTCNNKCLYCYANFSEKTVKRNIQSHNTLSPLLFGEVTDKDRIFERELYSCIRFQKALPLQSRER